MGLFRLVSKVRRPVENISLPLCCETFLSTVVFIYRASWVVTLRNRRTPPRPPRLAGLTSECTSRTLVRRLRPSRRCLCPGLHVTSRTLLPRRKSSPSGGSWEALADTLRPRFTVHLRVGGPSSLQSSCFTS